MTRLSDFLAKELKDYGAPARLARTIKISPATISHWASGKMTPDFDSCLKLAQYYELEPHQVFEMAHRPEFTTRYRELVAMTHSTKEKRGNRRKPEHVRAHLDLQRILDSGGTEEEIVLFCLDALAKRIKT